MPIINRREDVKNKIEFICSPLVEMAASLHVLSDPSHHKNCEGWVEKINNKLSLKLKTDIYFFSEQYNQWSFIMDIASEIQNRNSNIKNIHYLIDEIEKMDIYLFSYLFLGAGLVHKDKLKDWMDNPPLFDSEYVPELLNYLPVSSIRSYLHNYENIRTKVVETLRCYWKEIFSIEWPRIEKYEKENIDLQKSILSNSDTIDYILNLHGDLKYLSGKILLKKQTDFQINVDGIDRIVLLPSVFTSPHLMISIVENIFCIYINLNFRNIEMDEVPKSVKKFTKAINCELRLKIIRSLLISPKTTKELSDDFGFSKGTISEHLKILKETDLIFSRRIKKSVYYYFIPDNLNKNFQAIVSYIENK